MQVSAIPIAVSFKLAIPIAFVEPYALGGAGVYFCQTEYSALDDNSTEFAAHAAGGVNFNFGRFQIGAEARYVWLEAQQHQRRRLDGHGEDRLPVLTSAVVARSSRGGGHRRRGRSPLRKVRHSRFSTPWSLLDEAVNHERIDKFPRFRHSRNPEISSSYNLPFYESIVLHFLRDRNLSAKEA